jgi:hypothetical protein
MPPLPKRLAPQPIESFDDAIALGFTERNENEFDAQIEGWNSPD